MSTPSMSTVQRLRQAIAETIAVDVRGLEAAIGILVVATTADYSIAPADECSVHDADARLTLLLADRIPAGQEERALVAEIVRHHGLAAAQIVLGDRAEELLGQLAPMNLVVDAAENTLTGHGIGSDNAAHVRKAARLLNKAVALLEECGVTDAIDHCRRAVAVVSAVVAADDDAKIQAKRQSAAERAAERNSQRAPPSMPCDKDSLIREDGTLRYVSYMKGAGNRPEVVAVSFRLSGLPPLTTSFSLVGREVDDAYEAAVHALARHVGVDGDAALLQEMLSTRSAFKARYEHLGERKDGGTSPGL